MADRSILVRVKGDISDLKSRLAEVRADAASLSKTTDQANARSVASTHKVTAAEKQAATAAAVRASVRKAAAEDEIRSNEKLRISTEKYGKATATVLQHRDTIDKVGRGFTTVGIAAAAGVGLAITKFAEFDKQMSSVAATGEDARTNLAALRQASIDAGAASQYSATEAAAGVEALLKAGVSAADVLGGGLAGALNLAASGNLDVAGSAEAAATAMTQFGLSGEQVPHIADLLAAGAGKAQGEVSDMAAALNQGGLVASSFNLSIEETTGTLAAFASAGLVGSDAGTSFKTMLQRLGNPSKEAAATMKDLGVAAYDAEGNFVGVTSLAEQLKQKLGPLSQAQRDAAMATIFGSDAVRAANVLYKQGGQGIQDWINQTNDAGYAAEQARLKMDNLSGDLETLRGAFDTALISSGSGGNAFLRDLTEEATGFVNSYNRLPASTQQGTLKVVASIAGLGIGIGILAKVAVAAAETRVALMALGSTAIVSRLAALAVAGGPAIVTFLALEAAGHGLAAIFQDAPTVEGMEGFSKALVEISKGGPGAQTALDSIFTTTDAKTGKVSELAGGVSDLGSAFKLLNTVKTDKWGAGLMYQAENLIAPLFGVASQLGKVQDSFKGVDASLSTADFATASTGFSQIAAEAKKSGVSTEDLAAIFPLYAKKLQGVADAAKVVVSQEELVAWMGGKVPEAVAAAGSAAKAAGIDIAGLTDVTPPATATLAELTAQADKLTNSMLAAASGQLGMEQAIDDAAKSAKKMSDAQRDSGKAFDASTNFGRQHLGLLQNLAGKTSSYASSLAEQGKSSRQVAAAYDRGRSSLIANAVAMGAGAKEAEKLADEYLAIPDEIRTQFAFTGAKLSKAEAKDINRELKSIPKSKRAEIITIAETQGAKAAKRAIAEVKAKKVLAQVLGDAKGADKVRGAMARLKNRLVDAIARGDTKGAQRVAEAMARLKSKEVLAKVKADTSGATQARQALATVNNKVVTVTIQRNYTGRDDDKGPYTGGLITQAGVVMRGPLRRSNGGPVWGEGTATSDSIPAMLSDGEFVQRTAAVNYYGAGVMSALNRMQIPKDAFSAYGYKDGGKVGWSGLGYAAGGPVGTDALAILKYMAAVINPLKEVNTARRKIAEARDDLEDAKSKKARRKADRELTEATKELREAQKSAAESMKQTASALLEPYRSKSHDIDDWLESMKQGAADLKLFQGQIAQLRKLGVSEAIIKQITDQGAVVGSELAQQILDGGSKLAKTLNSANNELEKASNNLAYTATVKPTQKKATGGMFVGPGTGTSDSILARVSNGEWAVPQRNVQSNLDLLQAMTYGPTGRVRATPATAGSTIHYHQHAGNFDAGDIKIEGAMGNPEVWLRAAVHRKKDSLAMAGLRGRV